MLISRLTSRRDRPPPPSSATKTEPPLAFSLWAEGGALGSHSPPQAGESDAMATVLSPSSSSPHTYGPEGTWAVCSSFLKAPCIPYRLCSSRFGRRSNGTWVSPCYAHG